jgi:predicted chitinase
MPAKLPLLQRGDGIDYPLVRDAVKTLQLALGFPEAKADGQFGPGTETTLKNFQTVHSLPADGIVNQATWMALLAKEVTVFEHRQSLPYDLPRILNSISAVNIREPARQSLPLILGECANCGVTDPSQIAYILATAEHESHLGEWMTEFANGDAYEGRSDLGNTQPGDGPRFKGRGFVQLTGRVNYADWSNRLGQDLTSNPERVSEPAIAARILVQGMRDGTFTGYKLSDFLGKDFVNARQIINGLDRAKEIAAIAQRYLPTIKAF